jgi:hypothetical protein
VLISLAYCVFDASNRHATRDMQETHKLCEYFAQRTRIVGEERVRDPNDAFALASKNAA